MTFKEPNLMHTFYFFGNLEKKKNTRIALEFIFLVSKKFVIYKILNTQGRTKVKVAEGGHSFSKVYLKKLSKKILKSRPSKTALK